MELKITGEVWYWRGPSPFYFVTVPKKDGEKVKAIASQVTYGWGVIPVTAKSGKSEWTTSLFPKDGTYVVPIKKVVRDQEKINEGDVVKISLEI